MAIRRTPAARKRPNDASRLTPSPVSLDAGGHGSSAADEAGKASGNMAEDLAEQFADLLKSGGQLDEESASHLTQMFRDALDEAASSLETPPPPQRNDWVDAISSLQAIGEISEDESIELTRQLNDALEPLERRETQVALEFSRRLAEDGEEQALAWLREQSAKADNTERQTGKTEREQIAPALPSDTVNSRSRRLRGPPAGR